ncbi:MAG: EAL domain-containing protein [Vulcanimicrobiaceae bacterium]
MLAYRRTNGYRDVFLRHPQPMWVYDVETLRFLDVNDAACRAYGHERSAFLRLTIADIRPDDDRTMLHKLERYAADRPAVTRLWRHRHADGTTFYVDVTSAEIVFENKPARVVLAIDATARLAVSRALSESRAALAEAQELAHLGSFETDLVSGEMRWSAELFRIFGVDPALERPAYLYEFDHDDDRLEVAAEIERARVERNAYTSEHRIRTRDGRERYVFERGRFFFDPDSSEPRRVIGAVLDITERKSIERQLRVLAQHDALTNLPNRTLLRERLIEAMAHADASGRSVGVYFVDLDRFKTINDTIAHAAGDRLLLELASRLAHLVGDRGTVARPGGDEFIIVLRDVDSDVDGFAFGAETLASIAVPLPYEGTTVSVTASIGLSLYPRDGMTPDDLLRSADTAMYAAKARGGDAVEVYAAHLHDRAVAARELERALRDALDRNAIDVAFQPIVESRTGRVTSVEALARWRYDDRDVPPDTFIALAEETGLIMRLGTYVLERSCREAMRLAEHGFDDITMCVNISTRQFRQIEFSETVRDALARSRLPAHRLQLEITESAYLSVDSGLRNIEALEALGVALSIDDFGTGYSSLGYLKRLPVDALKIDRSFVQDILSDPADRAIVRAIIAVAANLGLTVIAEGVETLEQARCLCDLGCSLLQGFYYARALAPDDLVRFLNQPLAPIEGTGT